MKYKNAMVCFKAPDAESDAENDDGSFEAIVSVFNNVDSDGDKAMPGAFLDTLADWKSSGDPIPVWWFHRMDDPSMNVGAVQHAEELKPHDKRIPEWAHPWVKDNGGLLVKGKIDTGEDASPHAPTVRRLMRDRRVTQFSYAYDVVSHKKGNGCRELHKLKLYEISVTPIGANQMTELVGAKAQEPPAPDDSPAADGADAAPPSSDDVQVAIKKAVKILTDVLDSSGGNDAPVEDGPAKDEESEGIKSKEPTRLDAASIRLLGDMEAIALRVA